MRLRGQLAEARRRTATPAHAAASPSRAGHLRLAQGNEAAAAAAMRRALGECADPIGRAVLLPSFVQVMLAAGEIDDAERASAELDEIAAGYEAGAFPAEAAHARGAVSLARGDPQSALTALRKAERIWHELEAPYEGARVRALVGQACRALGDEDSAALHLEAARAVFEQLGAAPDLAPWGASPRSGTASRSAMSRVLRLVAAGKANARSPRSS